ncbi:MAG: hypothetical protein KDG52_06345 [Rhodocyclaceae bacterium]|nr:hypothetical protein [Rhodocyclaceae bacterium]
MDRHGNGGKAGRASRIGSDWIGWDGSVAHPDAPQGVGGPGYFDAGGGGFGNDAENRDLRSGRPDPEQPGPLPSGGGDEVPAAKPKAPNAPPATNVRSLGEQLKVEEDHVDVLIDAEVVADGGGGPANGAHTDFTWPAMSAPAFDSEDGKITKFKGKLTWKGTISIQTKYGTDGKATDLSCYGRGTTPSDVSAGDVTLGFHENCHQVDYANYLDQKILPNPPTLFIGMTPDDYNSQVADFKKAIADFRTAMETDSDTRTDEVGRKESEVASKGCFTHKLP